LKEIQDRTYNNAAAGAQEFSGKRLKGEETRQRISSKIYIFNLEFLTVKSLLEK
jgi:hypothetical protein